MFIQQRDEFVFEGNSAMMRFLRVNVLDDR
jgi:hypothetical protein